MEQTKKREHDENIKFEIGMNFVASKPKKTHNDKVLIEIDDV